MAKGNMRRKIVPVRKDFRVHQIDDDNAFEQDPPAAVRKGAYGLDMGENSHLGQIFERDRFLVRIGLKRKQDQVMVGPRCLQSVLRNFATDENPRRSSRRHQGIAQGKQRKIVRQIQGDGF